jgi:RNA polymerase sigma-70 factor (ECF subfamily)
VELSAGDRDPICLLYEQHARSVYRYLRGMVDQHEAEDLTQQVFLKLLTRLGSYEERPDVPFSAWLRRVAHNLAIDHLRARRPEPTDAPWLLSEVADELAPERSSSLREALAELPPVQRKVLVLRYIAGLSPGEIASELGRSEGAIHNLHHRGRGTLRRELIRRRVAPSTLARAA